MKLQPPIFSFVDALKFLGLEGDAVGCNQLLQHVEHDGLNIWITRAGHMIEVENSKVNIENVPFSGGARMPSVNIKEDEAVYMQKSRVRAGKVHISTGNSYELSTLRVYTIYDLDGQEYYLLSSPDSPLEDRAEKGTGECCMAYQDFEPDSSDEGVFNREELLEFAKGFNEDGSKKEEKAVTTSLKKDSTTNAALLVIGLVCESLAKDKPKFRISPGKPNLSQIRDHFLELASEFKVSNFGLKKADERILKEAMRYLNIRRD